MTCPFPSDPRRLVPLIFDPSSNSYFTLKLFSPSDHRPKHLIDGQPPSQYSISNGDQGVFQQPFESVSQPSVFSGSSEVALIDLEEDDDFLAEMEEAGINLDDSSELEDPFEASPFHNEKQTVEEKPLGLSEPIEHRKKQAAPIPKSQKIPKTRKSTDSYTTSISNSLPNQIINSARSANTLFSENKSSQGANYSIFQDVREPKNLPISNRPAQAESLDRPPEDQVTRETTSSDKSIPKSGHEASEINNTSPHASRGAFPAELKFKLSKLQRFFDKKHAGNPARYISYLQCVKKNYQGRDIPCEFPSCGFVIKNSSGKYFPIEEHLRHHFHDPLYHCETCSRKVSDPLRHLRSGHRVKDERLRFEDRLIRLLKRCFPSIVEALNLRPLT